MISDHEMIIETELPGLEIELLYELDSEERTASVWGIRILTFADSYSWQIIRLSDIEHGSKIAGEIEELLETECRDRLNEIADEAVRDRQEQAEIARAEL